MNVSFFANSSGVRINGGEFNIVNGNHTVFDQSRHTTNVNSFNTTNTTTIGSHNDNSRQYYKPTRPSLNPTGPDPDTSRGNGVPSNGPFPNGTYFPPPTVHPALMGGSSHLPPGSTVNNTDSFNTKQTTIDGAYNDNSQAYNIPSSAAPRVRNPNVGPQANPYQQQPQNPPYAQPTDQRRDEYFPPTTPEYGESRSSTGGSGPPGGWNRPRGRYYTPNAYQPRNFGRTSSTTAGHFYGGYSSPGPRNYASSSPGDVMHMPPELVRSLKNMLDAETGPPRVMRSSNKARDIADNQSDSSEEASTDEDDELTGPQGINNGADKLSLAPGPSTNPAYSNVKSDPQLPLQTQASISETMNRNVPTHAETMPSVPQHLEGRFMAQAMPTARPIYASLGSGSYSSPPPQTSPVPPVSSYRSPLEQFGLDDKLEAIQSTPIFNTYHGNVQKHDQRQHIYNFDSGNTHNTLINDSYNDNSIQTFAASDDTPTTSTKRGFRQRLGLKR